MYSCEKCDRLFKTKEYLTRHMKRVHSNDTPPPPSSSLTSETTPEQTTDAVDDAVELTVTAPPPPAKQSYHCMDCGAPVERGAATCAACGAELLWHEVTK